MVWLYTIKTGKDCLPQCLQRVVSSPGRLSPFGTPYTVLQPVSSVLSYDMQQVNSNSDSYGDTNSEMYRLTLDQNMYLTDFRIESLYENIVHRLRIR